MSDNLATDSRGHADHIPSATGTYSFKDAVQSIKSGQKLARAVHSLLSELSNQEKLSLLDGDVPFWEGLRIILCDRYNREPFVHGTIERVGIPGIKFTDGPRGVVMGASTTFPVSMSRGATWDVDLEERIGKAIGLEGRAQGANYFAGICINLPRHPAWGRIQETYSEDPLLLGAFGLALNNGVRPHLMTCVKHFALNSMENARFKVDVQVNDTALHEVYLPHFRRIVREGKVDSVMSSYNSVRGEFAGQNEELLTHILRDQWGFDGFVLSDFIFGLRDAVLSVKNGLDIEAPFRQQRALVLEKALESGELEWMDVDRACTRILRKQLEYACRVSNDTPDASVVFCEEHRALARETAAKGMVLLKNEPLSGGLILPIDPTSVSRIAVIGRLANSPNTGDRGSSAVFAPHVVTAYEGLKVALPNAEVILEDSDSVERAQKTAKEVDVVVCIVGYDAADEGEYVVPSFNENPALLGLLPPATNEEEREMLAMVQGQKPRDVADDGADDGLVPGAGGDRRSLRLRTRDVEIISAVTSVNPRTVIPVVGAGAVIMEEWIDKAPAVLMSWYAGCEGGHALADVLLGRCDASGRLPFSIPTSEEHLPDYDIDATSITYDRWFGQRLLDKLAVPARFPLGFGLSYTHFKVSDLRVDTSLLSYGEELKVEATIANTGTRAGRYVAQVYGTVDVEDFPRQVLLGFQPVDILEGHSKSVSISASLGPLQIWTKKGFVLSSRKVEIALLSFAGDRAGVKADITI